LSTNEVTLILVAEDSDDNREILRYILRSIGYGVLEARNGEQAVEMWNEKRPDLILMDLSMPVLDGYGAVRQIRKLEGRSAVPIIAVSAHAADTHRARALAVGCNDYLTKPVDFTQLEIVLHRYLNTAPAT
jgi:two-component system cell cycle response regulator DivK